MEKTLKEFLEQVDGEQIIHMGSSEGSAFWFVGTKDQLIENHVKLAEIEKNKLETQIINIRENYARLEDLYAQLNSYDLKCVERKNIKEIGLLAKLVANISKAVDAQIDNLPELRKDLRGFNPFLDRLVADQYPRIEGDGIVVLTEGKECGKFWNKKEYDEAVAKGYLK